MLADALFNLCNHIEAVFWIVVGVVCVGCAFRRNGVAAQRCWQAAYAFIAFGLSDIAEVRTGAWWRPWWLLVWKSICVAALLALLVDYLRRRRPPTTS